MKIKIFEFVTDGRNGWITPTEKQQEMLNEFISEVKLIKIIPTSYESTINPVGGWEKRITTIRYTIVYEDKTMIFEDDPE